MAKEIIPPAPLRATLPAGCPEGPPGSGGASLSGGCLLHQGEGGGCSRCQPCLQNGLFGQWRAPLRQAGEAPAAAPARKAALPAPHPSSTGTGGLLPPFLEGALGGGGRGALFRSPGAPGPFLGRTAASPAIDPFLCGPRALPLRPSFCRVAWAEISPNEPFCRLGSPGGARRGRGHGHVLGCSFLQSCTGRPH